MTRKIYILFILLTLALCVNAQSRYAEHSKLATGKWVKIRVEKEGVYQLTSANLKSMGFSNPAKVCLYGYNLPFLPEANIENLDDDLTEIPLYRKADGTMLFYSCGTTQWTRPNESSAYTHRNNPYSNYIYYFLTETTGTPATFSKTDAQAASSNIQKTYYAHALYEEDAFSFLNTGRTFFEAHDYANNPQKSYQLNFGNTTCGDVTIDVQFGAAGNSASTLDVSVNDNSMGTLAFSSLANYTYANVSNKTFTLYDQTLSSLNVKLKHTRTSGIAGHLDYIRATSEAQLSISGKDYVAFRPNTDGTSTFELAGATSSTAIWEVTTPSTTHELTGTLTGTTYSATASGAKFTDQYVAVNTNASFPTPQTVGNVAHQDLHALDNINLLIIVPANGKLTEQAQRLAAAHTQYDGIKCAVVEADKVYNEFSSGTPDATAYRRLMKMLYDKQYTSSPLTGTQKGSLNLLLFGNCMWDNRFVTNGLTSKSQDDYLLAYESDNSWSHTDSYVAEEYFTLLADGKGISPLKELPDCGVGRLPVSFESDAKNVVDKLIRYMSNTYAGAWKNTICMMGDDDKTNIHMEDAENVLTNTQKNFPDYHYQRIYWDSYTIQRTATGNDYPDVYANINKTMQEGALIMNYTGHGAAYCLSHEQILKTKDFQDWTSPRIPVWVTAACDVTPFDMNTENIGTEAIINKQGAAVAFIGTARTVYSSPNRVINRNFMSHVLGTKNNGEHYTIGEALAQAKADIITSKKNSYFSKIDSINKVHFVLLGDPAIKLITPTHKVTIDKFNGKSIDTSNPSTISAAETITIEGHIANTNGEKVSDFNGTVSAIVYDSEEHIVCKLNAGIDIEPYEYDDRTRVLYAGTDSVKAGTFKFTFPVPLDINYSDLPGLINLYAINTQKDIEANGTFEDFLIGGTSTEEQTDTIGPSIAAFSNGHNVKEISYTNETPTLRIELSDESGINTTGNGLGHDIVAIIDNNEATTYTLNSYYTQAVGDYRSGTVTYTLPTLPAGKHSLVIRAFDTLNNMGAQAYSFEVVTGLTQVYDIFDMTGRKVYSNSEPKPSLPPGIYVRRTRLTSPKGDISTSSEKFISTQ
ncbi:MAG: type IX secretion system sortase PorU [Bacteroidaceae bacterium]|nr:type IX secretion system sortase PorU [Bacteroidaceae bacterium]